MPNQPLSEAPAKPQTDRTYRLSIVLLAALASIAVWGLATLLGVDLEVNSPAVGRLSIDAFLALVTALPLSFAAWGVLALLERSRENGLRVWRVVAVALLVVSLLPLPFLDATPGTKAALAAMHLGTGIILVALLPKGPKPNPEPADA
ncbi:membrane protease YdiL (CAAX protease family) [Microbacterium trichothecenolyticum]|uniref:DUF6069 family protein n=1 Tax=Microbacterium trichothecenolyticum TaxID=69370 RepID=UPI002861E997|nr:DUF6069 family protein [Microbacterium trichothecenolyticum]MDR7182980.1 membrane protease YdiL (CAAX protease family) [Microbacterium trichothecenolyticum]